MSFRPTVLIMNGPNLGALGQRQPHIYGQEGMNTLPELTCSMLGEQARTVDLIFFQSNHEGALIDRLEQARKEYLRGELVGVVLNAGAFTHTSLALADCLAWIGVPCVEVHLSNVHARKEPVREHSFIAQHCLGVISGFGLRSYALGVLALMHAPKE